MLFGTNCTPVLHLDFGGFDFPRWFVGVLGKHAPSCKHGRTQGRPCAPHCQFSSVGVWLPCSSASLLPPSLEGSLRPWLAVLFSHDAHVHHCVPLPHALPVPRMLAWGSPLSVRHYGSHPSRLFQVVLVSSRLTVVLLSASSPPRLLRILLRMRLALYRSFLTWLGKRPTYILVSSACLGKYFVDDADQLVSSSPLLVAFLVSPLVSFVCSHSRSRMSPPGLCVFEPSLGIFLYFFTNPLIKWLWFVEQDKAFPSLEGGHLSKRPTCSGGCLRFASPSSAVWCSPFCCRRFAALVWVTVLPVSPHFAGTCCGHVLVARWLCQ